MSLKLVPLVGSVRSDRQGIKAARFVERSLTARGHDVTLVDPVEARLPLLDRMYKVFPRKSSRFNHFLDPTSWLLLALEASFW